MKSFITLTTSLILLAAGTVLIFFSISSLSTAINESRYKFHVDFGCGGIDMNSPPKKNIWPPPRIEYCIDYSAYDTASGSSVYASGETDRDTITVKELEFKRVGQTLFVNNQKVEFREEYETFEQWQSRNPWLKETKHIVIRNAGISSAPPGTIRVEGMVKGGRSFSPPGLLILILGIGLFLLGMEMRRKNDE